MSPGYVGERPSHRPEGMTEPPAGRGGGRGLSLPCCSASSTQTGPRYDGTKLTNLRLRPSGEADLALLHGACGLVGSEPLAQLLDLGQERVECDLHGRQPGFGAIR